MEETAIDRLAGRCGIERAYWDIWGEKQVVSRPTLLALLKTMGLDVESEIDAARALADMEQKRGERLVDPVRVFTENTSAMRIPLRLPTGSLDSTFEWILMQEDGQQHGDTFLPSELEHTRTENNEHFVECILEPGPAPAPGYHWLEIREVHLPHEARILRGKLRLIVTPGLCYMPSGLEGQGRVWGPAVQLYAVSSSRNWGVGDLTDLADLVKWSGDIGAGIIGVSPLNHLFPTHPEHTSPYSPSSRLHLNELYIDVEAVNDFHECEKAKKTVLNPEFQARLTALRETELIDYPEVAAVKRPVLEMLFQHFREHHLKPETQRGGAFRDFQGAGGEALFSFGVFQALQEFFHSKNPDAWGWQSWPGPYQNPQSQEVKNFAVQHRDRVEFHQYLQWQATLQLREAGRRAMEAGLKVGLYQDLPLGVDPAGFETWSHHELYALGARIGAPPDDFNLKGQDWGLPPFVPARLKETAYEPFAAVLRANMGHAGAVRIDHVMQLMRLFWVPPGRPPSEGAYVHYPFKDLLGILALESRRNRCLVIGEDLGTVPEEIREELLRIGVLSYRLLYFEKNDDGSFKKPGDYPEQALVAVTTHDLPTLYGFWRGEDMAAKERLGMFPTDESRQVQILARFEDRVRLLFALEQEALLPEGTAPDPGSLPEMPFDLATAIYRYLAKTPSKILMFQLEDVLGQAEQVNLPGTTHEYPNWKRKLPAVIESFSGDSRFKTLTVAMALERGTGVISSNRKQREMELQGLSPIPVATYRLQFKDHFTFREAARIAPYLKSLGVSHLYSSPFLKARPGSAHCYDIVDHTELNPELGGKEGFDHLSATLRGHGMGFIADIVPNHMAAGSDNPWWVDVLENGEASLFAEFFDISWESLKDDRGGKILLPVLEDHYGIVLESGLLRLTFERAKGAFTFRYRDHCFPLDPGTCGMILGHGITRLDARLNASHHGLLEFQSLITAFDNLPGRGKTEEQMVATRSRDKEVHKRRLALICEESPEIAEFVEETVALLNGSPGRAKTFENLHEILEAQAYRLAYWRVASDDINYRRFFDINDLAGLRMENRKVFEESHRLLLDLIGEGKVQGLRIDHIDGLYDPLQYCRWLREAVDGTLYLQQGREKELRDFYVVVEKILAAHEKLPEGWPVHGTTGYNFADLTGGLFVDSANEREMTRLYASFAGVDTDFQQGRYHCKKLIMNVALSSELNVLADELNRIAEARRHTRDFTLNRLRQALVEVVAFFPVYRTYVNPESIRPDDRRYVDWAVALAKKKSRAADTSVYEFVRRVLLLDVDEEDASYRHRLEDFTMRFQQFTGPVMAKGLEDTSHYVYNRLISLNEVGGDPSRFGCSVSAFHVNSKEQAAHWPHSMLNTTTHDSKRSEDVRARISLLSEVPDQWRKAVKRWSRLNRSKKQQGDAMGAPSKNDEYALYQNLLGSWPLPEEERSQEAMGLFRRRMETYVIKMVREAKTHSSWINPDPEYEDGIVAFAGRLLDGGPKNVFLREFIPFQRHIARLGMFNSLSQALLKLTAPGVPDIYQGNEVWNFSLVDPDNRRPVDFQRLSDMLDHLQNFVSVPHEALVEKARLLLETMEDGRIKLYVTWKTLSLRRDCRDIFQNGAYVPLNVYGEKSEHLCAFARSLGRRRVVVVAPRLIATLCGLESGRSPVGGAIWGETWVEMSGLAPHTGLRHLFTGERLETRTHEHKTVLPAAALFAHFPLALLTEVA